MESFVFERRSVGDVEVVSPKGRLDAPVAADGRETLTGIIAEGRVRIVVDLEDVTFVDSMGLSVLITALKVADSAGGGVALARLSDSVRSIIELTRLHRVFHIFQDVEAAVQDFAAPVSE